MNLKSRIEKLEKIAQAQNHDILFCVNFYRSSQTAGFECNGIKLPRMDDENIESVRDRAIKLFKKPGQPVLISGYKDEL